MNWTNYNLDSEMRELIRNQGFSILYVQTDETGPQVVGTYNYIRVPMDATVSPGFASPDSAVAKSLMDYQKGIEEAMFEIAEQNGVTGVKTEMSGEAKAWDFQAHGNVLKKMAMMCKKAEFWVADMFKRYTDEKFGYGAEYREDYAPRGTKARLDIYDQVIALDIGPETNRLAYKKTVLNAFSDVDPDDLKPVVDEINDMSEDDLRSKNLLPPPPGQGEGDDDQGMSAK